MRMKSVSRIKLFECEEKDYMSLKFCTSLIFITLFSTLIACGGVSSIEVQYSVSCNSATGQDTTCTVTLSNSSSSTGNFDWTASSSPSGAQFNPVSGSVAPGASSDQIQVTIPAGICPFTLTFADSNGTSVSSDQTSCWRWAACISDSISLLCIGKLLEDIRKGQRRWFGRMSHFGLSSLF